MAPAKNVSLMALSLLSFALADVRDGLGPFLGVYLQGKGWMPDEIGYVMTAGGLAGMLFTTPLGALTDSTRHKRFAMAVATVLIVLSVMAVFLCQSFVLVAGMQVVQGIMAAAIAPLLTSISLGVVGQKGLAHRLGQNEAWNHFGNFSTAALGGLVGYFYGIPGVFAVMLAMGLFSVLFVMMVNPAHIDHDVARGLEEKKDAEPMPVMRMLATPSIFVVGMILFFFHLGNAALLPLLGQSAVATFRVNPAVYTAATVILAQLTMVPMALWAAKIADKRGYGLVILLALLALPVRGLVAGFWHSPWSILPVQILDGVGAGLIGVATPGIVARILRGTGHVNLGLGVVMTLQGIGAASSSTLGGLFAHHAGYSAAFLALTVAACCAVVLFLGARKWLPAFRRELVR
ncbi:MFS transporter [Oxalobacter sp. OxGP1]|uniref:MFS transporter n=1 Tax=Oxalobacter paeniformigenes TaxID=2946594 RepID=UPI0022AF2457|nr:MFS transporter [Oxalobacter paeniformigenes]MCZ4052286.1 MFS transporter [Oxalobacter paeniformigenes]